MSLKLYIQLLEDKSTIQIQLGCSRKEEGPVITETGLQFTKMGLRLVNVKKKF